MDRLAAMRVFVAVVEVQGFSAASRLLRIPLPTVSRKIADLERHLGAQLLIRSTRKFTVTDSGQRYYEDARRILDDIDDAERSASGEYRRPKGRLTITSPTMFGRLHVLPIVNGFMRVQPDIDVRCLLTNVVVDLLSEQINLGIRIGPLSDNSLIAIQAGSVRQIICASPGYFSRHGRPRSPDDLASHQCISFALSATPAEWSFKTPSGTVQRVRVHARLMLNSIEGIVDAARGDGGIAMMYSYQAAPHIADGALEIVMDDHEIDPLPVTIIHPQGRLVPQKVRTFIDFAMPRLRKRLAVITDQCSA